MHRAKNKEIFINQEKKMKTEKKQKPPKDPNAIPSVLAFEKKLVCSDGFMYGLKWEDRANENRLEVIEKSVRGTMSSRLSHDLKNDPLKLNAKIEVPNLQKIDACSLNEDMDTLKVRFTLKVFGNLHVPTACNSLNFKKNYEKAVSDLVAKNGLKEISKRYALNIANARFFWRNRVGAEKVEVVVRCEDNLWTFNALDYSLNDFNFCDEKVDALAEVICKALSSDSYALLDISAYAMIGAAQEVYPSQELIFEKGSGEKSKVLYSVNNTAAMHSQKIGNALRTIDTWYSKYEPQNGFGPIPIEPFGAVTTLGMAFRTPPNKDDFYTLFDAFSTGQQLANKSEENYVMAVLVRGGVFGESGK
jgi:CRISPR-associated protein Csy3